MADTTNPWMQKIYDSITPSSGGHKSWEQAIQDQNAQVSANIYRNNLYKAMQFEQQMKASDPAYWMSSLNSALGGASGGLTASATNPYETRLNALMDNPDSIQQTAGYKFRVGQGMEALQRSLAAKGLLNSGNRLQEMQKLGQDMASQEYDNQANRLTTLLQGKDTYNAQLNAADASRYGARANAMASMAKPFIESSLGNKAYNTNSNWNYI